MLNISFMAKLHQIESFNEITDHVHDHYTGLGYVYERNLLKNVVSQELFANPLNDIPMRQLERMIEDLVNKVKNIKLQYSIALPKNSKLLN